MNPAHGYLVIICLHSIAAASCSATCYVFHEHALDAVLCFFIQWPPYVFHEHALDALSVTFEFGREYSYGSHFI
jgi:uncharacterized membrane protein YobD (UPF0266 family)